MVSYKEENAMLRSVGDWARQLIEKQTSGNLFLYETKITIERFGIQFLTNTGEPFVDEFWAREAKKPIRFQLRFGWSENRAISHIIEEETVDEAVEEVAYGFIRHLRDKFPSHFGPLEDDPEEPVSFVTRKPAKQADQLQLAFDF